ncbi:MAG: MATE family efflux transporter [Cytophagales bacterium]
MELQSRLTEYRKTFLLAYPVSLAYLSHIMTGLIDNIMVGQIGADKLAASSLANTVMVMPMVFGLGMSFGLTPLVANAHGQNNISRINTFQQSGLLVNTGIGVMIFLLMFYSTWIFQYLDQEALIVELAIPYLKVIAISMIPFMVFQNYKQFADGVSITKTAMYISIIGNAFNIILNYILIFGKLGFPAYGLMGAGYATLISRILMALGMMFAVLYLRDFKDFKIKVVSSSALGLSNIRDILNIGGPSGMQMVFEAGAFSISAIMVGWIGYRELASHQIAISIASATYVMAAGLGAASTIRVGNQLGAMKFDMVRTVGKIGMEMSAIFMAIAGLIFIILNTWLPTLYVEEISVIKMASSLIIISAAFQIFDGLQVAAMGALRGLSDVKWPTLIAVFSYWGLGLPCSYIFAFWLNMGVQGVWYGFIIGLGSAAILLGYRFFRKTKPKTLIKIEQALMPR